MSDDRWAISDVEFSFGSGERPMNYDAYLRIQNSINANIPKVGKEESLERRRENTRQWLSSVPSKWRKETLKTVPFGEDLRKMLKERKIHSFFITAPASQGLSMAYAILRVFVSRGGVSPDQIVVTSEEEILATATAGFDGAASLKSLLRGKVFMITVGEKIQYTNKETALWSRIISKIFEEDLTILLVSGGDFEEFLEFLPQQTAQKLEDLVGENIVGVQSSNGEGKFDAFEG